MADVVVVDAVASEVDVAVIVVGGALVIVVVEAEVGLDSGMAPVPVLAGVDSIQLRRRMIKRRFPHWEPNHVFTFPTSIPPVYDQTQPNSVHALFHPRRSKLPVLSILLGADISGSGHSRISIHTLREKKNAKPVRHDWKYRYRSSSGYIQSFR